MVVPDEVAERPADEAAERGTTTEDLAAEVLAGHVPPEKRRLRFIGIGSSGRHDLAARSEEILRERFAT